MPDQPHNIGQYLPPLEFNGDMIYGYNAHEKWIAEIASQEGANRSFATILDGAGCCRP